MKISLRGKISLFVTLVILVISAASTYLFVLQHKRHIEDEFISRGTTLSYLLSKIADEGIAAEKLDLINRAAFIFGAEDVIKARVYTDLWDVLESYPSQEERRLHPEAVNHFKAADSPFYIKHDNEYDFYRKVIFQPYEGAPSIHVGFVAVDLSAFRMRKAINGIIVSNIITGGIITLIAVLALNILIARIVGKPVTDLHNSVLLFKDGKIPEIKPGSSEDEIGRLADEFNRMSHAIKEKENMLIESERNITSLFERTEHAIFRLDKNGAIIKTNSRFNEMFGDNVERLCDILLGGKKVHDYFGSGVSGNVVHLEEKVVVKNGSEFIILLSLYADRDDKGDIRGFDGYMVDLTASRCAEENTRLAAKVMESTLEGIFVTDDEFNILTVNPSFIGITGLSPEEAIGKKPAIMSAGHKEVAVYQQAWRAVRQIGKWQGEVWNRHKGGEIYTVWMNLNTIRDHNGKTTNCIGVFTDITQRRLFEEHLKRAAHYDMLTGLPNRVPFNDRLNHAMAQSRRSRKKLAIMFMDLDNFKPINDTYGHDIGDQILQETAQRLRGCVRESDTIARFGGDEFVFIISDIKDTGNIALIIQQFFASLSMPFYPKGNECFIKASIGISIYPDDADDAEGLLKNADTAMYYAKKQGGNNYQIYVEDATNLEL